MTNLENFKDIRTVASVSALVAVGISSSYFLNENSNRKDEIAEVKKHLAAIIPQANPDIAKNLNDAIKAIQLLDSRLAKAQEDIRILSQNALNSEEHQSSKRVYKRLTQRDEPIINKPKFAVRPKIQEEEPDIEDDIAAMMG